MTLTSFTTSSHIGPTRALFMWSGKLKTRRSISMKALNYFATAILAVGLASIPALAQTQPDTSQQPTQSQPSQAQPGQTASDSTAQSQALTGTIVKGSDG